MSLPGAELLALGCAFLWAVNALVLRSLSASVSPAAMNAIRCGAAGLAFLVWLPFDQPLSSLAAVPLSAWGLLLLSLVTGIVVGDTLYLIALREIGVSRSMPLSGTFPLSTLLFEHLLLDTSLRPSLLIGSLLVVAGVVLLSRSRAPAPPQPAAAACLRLGLACALLSAVLWGFAVTLLRPALDHMTQLQANAVRMPIVALLLYLAVVRPSGERLRGLRWRTWLLLGGSGLLGMGLGAYMFLTAVERLGPARAVTLTSASPVFGLALAVLFLRERVDALGLVGAACCLAGVWVVF